MPSDYDDHDRRPSREEAEAAVSTLLRWAGEDSRREGLRDTPSRVAKAYRELFSGYTSDPLKVLDRVFDDQAGYQEPVIVSNIAFASTCEHHMLPFLGFAHVGYYPVGGVVGLSKIARLVDVLARRLQTQERMTAQVVDAMDAALRPSGIAVMIEAEHLCMTMRGVAKPGTKTLTTRFTGRFADDPAQSRFLSMIVSGRPR